LDVRFKRGEVTPNNDGDVKVAMILGVDSEPIDLIITCGREDVYEVLLRAREAVTFAMTQPSR